MVTNRRRRLGLFTITLPLYVNMIASFEGKTETGMSTLLWLVSKEYSQHGH